MYIVEAVVAIVEMVVHLIMVLLGWDSGGSQTIEYYEVHNIPLFDDPDKKNPLLQSVAQSVVGNTDITANLIQATLVIFVIGSFFKITGKFHFFT